MLFGILFSDNHAEMTDRPFSTPPFHPPINSSNLHRKTSPPPPPQSYLHQEVGPIQDCCEKSAPESPPLQTTTSFMRLIAPLKHTLSMSADNIPKPLSVTKNLMAKGDNQLISSFLICHVGRRRGFIIHKKLLSQSVVVKV